MSGEAVEERRWDTLIIDGGVTGLTAARDLMRAGLRPLLIEARGYTGGLVAIGGIDRAHVNLGAGGFVVYGQTAVSMLAKLGLHTTTPHGRSRFFLPPLTPDAGAGSPRWGLHRFLGHTYLGIPTDPLAANVVTITGQKTVRRAVQDADLLDAVGIGPEDPGDLVFFMIVRVGVDVLERPMRPIVAGIHSVDPTGLVTGVVVPGLRQATTELGSLSIIVVVVLGRRRARKDKVGDRSVDTVVEDGLFRLADTLHETVETSSGNVHTRTGAQWLRPDGGQDYTGEEAPTV